MYLLYRILGPLFWLLVIGAILRFVIKRFSKQKSLASDQHWYLRLALSKEDAVSQLFFVLAVGFLGVTLFTLNRQWGEPLSWRSLLLVTTVICAFLAYYYKLFYLLIAGILSFPIWWGAQVVEWGVESKIRPAVLASGLLILAILYYLLGRAHEADSRYKRFSLAYLIIGLMAITGGLFFLSTKPGIESIYELTGGDSIFTSLPATMSIILFFGALIIAIFHTGSKKLASRGEILSVLFLAVLFSLFIWLPEQKILLGYEQGLSYKYSGKLTGVGIAWAVLFNLVLFFEILGLILLGYLRREEWLINLGALFLFLLIIVKYFDWFFTSLDKSIFFIGAGILMFVLGWALEKGRKYVIAKVESESLK